MLSQGTVELKEDRVLVLGYVLDDHHAKLHTQKHKTIDEDEIAYSLSDLAEVVRAPKTREQLQILYGQLLDSLNNKGLESSLDESNESPRLSAARPIWENQGVEEYFEMLVDGLLLDFTEQLAKQRAWKGKLMVSCMA
ncbi:hypothetical protein ACH5RR_015905 [Cinchona calisaya]|uniref:Uncharacterized protein n=1 Tax=Cinchona calisaya TaxID=153742 RepID=A0ABD2ZUH9_9GENT